VSNIVRFFRVSGHFGSGFGFLVTQVISGFGSFGSGYKSFDIRFQVISGRTGPDRILFCDILCHTSEILTRIRGA
jgi:hypothetical protein